MAWGSEEASAVPEKSQQLGIVWAVTRDVCLLLSVLTDTNVDEMLPVGWYLIWTLKAMCSNQSHPVCRAGVKTGLSRPARNQANFRENQEH
jgi:hypothetical protein